MNIGERIGDYEIVQVLGRAGWGRCIKSATFFRTGSRL